MIYCHRNKRNKTVATMQNIEQEHACSLKMVKWNSTEGCIFEKRVMFLKQQ